MEDKTSVCEPIKKNQKVKTITIQVEPAYFNLEMPTERMTIKRSQVVFVSKNYFDSEYDKKWSYRSNTMNLDILYEFIDREVEKIMDLGYESYTMDGELVTITQVFEDNSRRHKIFTGSFKINGLDLLASYLVDLVPGLEDVPNFLFDFHKEKEDLEF